MTDTELPEIAALQQKVVLLCLHKHGPMSRHQIAQHLKRSTSIVQTCTSRLVKMYNDRALRESGQGPNHVYSLGSAFADCSTEQLHKHFGLESMDYEAVLQVAAEQSAGVKLARDDEAVAFFKLNAPWFSQNRIAQALGCTYEAVGELALVLDWQGRDGDEDRCHDISADFEFLPIGTEVQLWARGTKLIFQSATPGILGVTRHYAAED